MAQWRRKFTVSQEVADGSSKKLTELRVDYNAIKREKDVLELRLEDLNRKQQSTVDSLDKVESDCDRLGKEKVSDSIIAALLASQVKSTLPVLLLFSNIPYTAPSRLTETPPTHPRRKKQESLPSRGMF